MRIADNVAANCAIKDVWYLLAVGYGGGLNR